MRQLARDRKKQTSWHAASNLIGITKSKPVGMHDANFHIRAVLCQRQVRRRAYAQCYWKKPTAPVGSRSGVHANLANFVPTFRAYTVHTTTMRMPISKSNCLSQVQHSTTCRRFVGWHFPGPRSVQLQSAHADATPFIGQVLRAAHELQLIEPCHHRVYSDANATRAPPSPLSAQRAVPPAPPTPRSRAP